MNTTLGEILLIAQQLTAADEVPVGHEDGLQHVDGIAFDPQVHVPPRAERCTLNITVGHVDAARKADPAVYHGNFAVVAVVEFAGQPRKGHRHEGIDTDTLPAQPAHVPTLEIPTAHIVEDQPHLYPFGRLLLQQGEQLPADLVLLDDVILQVYRRGGLPNSLKQGVELLSPTGQDPHLVAHGQQSAVVVQQQSNQVFLRLDRLDVLNLWIDQIAQLHAAEAVDLLEVVDLLAVEYLFLPVIAAEDDIEDQSEDRQEGHHQNPRQRLDRIAPVVDDYHDRSDDDQYVQDRNNALDVRRRYDCKPDSVHTSS